VRHDYIVIGSGAGGAAAAWRLAQTGRRVLVLEKGGKLPTDGSTLDVDRVLRQAAFTSEEVWRVHDGRAVALKEYFNLGGKTKWFGGALVRFERHEFDADADHRCRAWPIGYDDLEPYYAEAEDLLSVRSVEVEPDLRRLLDGLRRYDTAWEEHPLPLGLAPRIADHDQEARRFDGGFASPGGLKSDAEVCLLDRIKRIDDVAIACRKEVVALTPADGDPRRIGAVICADGSRYEAKVVVLAAGALHSPRLIQRYLRRHGGSIVSPSVGQIGRNYKRRLSSVLLAISPQRTTDLLRKTVLLFHPACPHSSVQTIGWIDGEVLGARLPGLIPQAVSNAIGARAYGFWLSTEDGSSPENRVIDGNGASYPTLDYDAARLPEARVEHRRLRRMLQGHLLRLGHVAPVRKSPFRNTAYACGTLVTGDDPDTSAVAPDGRVHAFENLYVADGSVLPRSGRVNPALTIYAWALRVGDLLAHRAQARQGQ
jgi:choline dehydrogenase-like flavoprotein